MEEIPLYWTEPDAIIAECRIITARRINSSESSDPAAAPPCWALVLQGSPFYPGGGGQPADRGTIADFPLLSLTKSDGTILHSIQSSEVFIPGETVTCVVDKDFRRDSRQQHSGQHLLSAALAAQGLGTISVHLGADYCGIEVDSSAVNQKTVDKVLEYCEELIQENRPIHSRMLSYEDAAKASLRRPLSRHADDAAEKQKPVRVVEIDSLDAVGCGGVHLERTGDIRGILFDGEEKIRGHVRLKWTIGDRVVKQAGRQSETIRELSRILSAEPENLKNRVETLLKDSRESGKHLEEAEKALGALFCEQAPRAGDVVAWNIGGAAHRISGALDTAADLSIRAGFFLGDADTDGIRPWGIYLQNDAGPLFADIRNELISPAGGKGGGRPPMWRGMISGDSDNLREQFLELMKSRSS